MPTIPHHVVSPYEKNKNKCYFEICTTKLITVKIRETKSIGPALVSRIFFKCLILDCYNISICKKGKVKDETTKKIRETNGSQYDLHLFHKFSLDVLSYSERDSLSYYSLDFLRSTQNLKKSSF